MPDSRLSGLYRKPVAERIDALEQRGWLSADNANALRQGRHVMSAQAADRVIENVIGAFALPFAVAPNFLVNGRDYIVPLVVEEPSIVAALSGAARLARDAGGFEATCDESLLAAQVHLAAVPNAAKAVAALTSARDEILDQANGVHPRLVQRGGGVRDVEVTELALPGGAAVVRVDLLVDTCDAMGANLVNTIAETMAPRLAELAGGEPALRILSNLVDRSLVTARVAYPVETLARDTDDGVAVRDAIVLASDIASVDPYRAATHNKGVMNGIDALALATGNDWRAIEAGAHAFAASSGAYRPLTRWSVGDDGALAGEIKIPLKPGIVGGTLDANPAARIGLEIAAIESARELAELMACVGLAQNFAAIRALVTRGIQEGHMRLHARSVAAGIGTPAELFEDVVGKLVESGEIKDWKAREILAAVSGERADSEVSVAQAAGKVILFGEHAAVYGRHALALPIPGAVTASVRESGGKLTLTIPEWGVANRVIREHGDGPDGIVNLILDELGIATRGFDILLRSSLPRAMGLGSSAAFAVAIVRGLDVALGLGLDDERVNAIAFECEKLSHGTPSGIDNTIATYGQPLLFRRGERLETTIIELAEAPPLVIASSGQSGLTREQVDGVRLRREKATASYDAIFDQIDAISVAGAASLVAGEYEELGLAMNVCHGLLNAIGVSTPELERMVGIARESGAVGAKLTGAGGGGSIVALCPGHSDDVSEALTAAGYRCMSLIEEGNKR